MSVPPPHSLKTCGLRERCVRQSVFSGRSSRSSLPEMKHYRGGGVVVRAFLYLWTHTCMAVFALMSKHFVRPADAPRCRFGPLILLVSHPFCLESVLKMFTSYVSVFFPVFPLHTVLHTQPCAYTAYLRNKLWTIETSNLVRSLPCITQNHYLFLYPLCSSNIVQTILHMFVKEKSSFKLVENGKKHAEYLWS